ncbi:MAG: hypothetical protein PHT68_02590 [Azovibrio restrictus]|nr:hypothetical protein [Azovibrio restrictus]
MTMELKPIQTEQEHQEALAEIERLWDASENTPEAARLEVLVMKVEAYEQAYILPSSIKERCIEFAKLEKLWLHHWRLLTGVTGGEDDYVICNQEGVFPTQYDDRELSLLSAEEAFEIGEVSVIEPLRFPCLPSELLRFVDQLIDVEVPDEFRVEVERLARGADSAADGGGEIVESAIGGDSKAGGKLPVKDAIAPYIRDLSERFPVFTAKRLYAEAEKESGSDRSPFLKHKKGEKLVLKECERECAQSTFGKVLSVIKNT